MSLDHRQVQRKKNELHEVSKKIRRQQKSIEDLEAKIRDAATQGEEHSLNEQRILKIAALRMEENFKANIEEELYSSWES